MAGQGYRTFVAGEQLTDTKMQNFLMDQSVMRFANEAARTTALDGVVSEGMVTYLDDTNQLQVFNGSAFVAVTPDVPDATPTVKGVVFGSTNSNATFPNAIGHGALQNDANGGGFLFGNIAFANNAGGLTTTGAGNIFIGHNSGQNNTTGSTNIAIGTATLANNTTGQNNTSLGSSAGVFSASGSAIDQCTFLGANTNLSTNNFLGSNNTLIGFAANQSTTNVSNQITLGNSSITSLRCQVTTISALSDIRDKKNVEPLPYGLNIIQALKPVTFDWNMRDGAKVDVPDFGFIAQDLAAVEDEHDAQRLALTLRDNPERLEATPGRLIPILVKAIQELTARVEELENARQV